jgi:hypothetical protein
LYPAAYNKVYNSFIIPLRINYSVSMLKAKLTMQVFVGYSQGINLEKYLSSFKAVSYSSPLSLLVNFTRGFSDIGTMKFYYNNGSRYNDTYGEQYNKGSYRNLSVGVHYNTLGSQKGN